MKSFSKILVLLVLLACVSISYASETKKILVVRWDVTQNYALGFIGIKQYFSEKGLSVTKQLNFFGKKAMKETILAQIKEYDPDLIMTLGTSCTKIVKAGFPNKSIVYGVVYDAKKAKLIADYKSSGNNLVGVNTKLPWIKKLKMIKKISKKMKKIGTIFNENELNSKISLDDMVQDAKKVSGMNVVSFNNTSKKIEDIKATLTKFNNESIDLFLTNNDNYTTHTDNIKEIVRYFEAKKIPVFGKNRQNVDDGALIAISGDYIYNGYQTAKLAHQVLNGKKPSDLSSEFTGKTNIFVNINTLKRLKVRLPLSILKVAKKIKK